MKVNHAQRDAEYRAALGLSDDEPLPNKLGQVAGHNGNPSRRISGVGSAKPIDPDRRKITGYREPQPPPGTDLGSADLALRSRRSARALRAVHKGDVESTLDDYAEAIATAERTRDNARTKNERQAASGYVIRLKDRRDALMRSAGREHATA